MFDSLKRSFGGEKPVSSEYSTLMSHLSETKAEISDLNSSINYVTDPILLNQLIFQLKAAEMRYRYWFCLARDMEISADNDI